MFNRGLGFSSVIWGIVALLLTPILVLGQIGGPAKDFTLQDINSASGTYQQQITLADSRGMILVLFFFTSRENQAQQREILTALNNGLWANYSGTCMRFYAIGGFARESESELMGMIPSGANFPVLYDPDSAAWGDFGTLYASLSSAVAPLAVVITHEFTIHNYIAGVATPSSYNPTIVGWVETLDPYDTEGPTFENFSPPHNSTDLPLCTVIEFDIFDQCGVDIGWFDFRRDMIPGLTLDISTEPISGGYHVTIQPDECWLSGRSYSFEPYCLDNAGNEASVNYSITVVDQDQTAPVWTNRVPQPDATNVDPNIVISFDIYDDESCLYRGNLHLYLKLGVDGSENEMTGGADITALSDHEGYHVEYDHPTPYTVGDMITVRLTVHQLCGGYDFDESYSFTVGEGGPGFYNEQPADGSTDVTAGAVAVSVDIVDVTSAIDPNSIEMRLDGAVKGTQKTAIANGYTASFTTNLADGQRYTVSAYAENARGRSSSFSWWFSTTDNTPPRVTSKTPSDGAYNVPTDTDIRFTVVDTGVGVSPGSIRLWVNGDEVSTDPSFVKEQRTAGDDGVYDCTYVPARAFTEGQVITVQVQAADFNNNWMDGDLTVVWSFTCAAVPLVRLAGWGDTRIFASGIGSFEAWAVVEYGEGMPKIRNVQIYSYDPSRRLHYPLGIFLCHIGYFSGHGVFHYEEFVPRGNQVGLLPIFEIAAEDVYGEFSALWPYLTIVDRATSRAPLAPDFDPTDIPWRVDALMNLHGASQSWETDAGLLDAIYEGASMPIPVGLGNSRPVIFVGGFYPQVVDVSVTSDVSLTALVLDPDGPEDIERVEVYVEGMPTGVFLRDDGTEGDDVPGDGFYVKNFTIEAFSRPVGLLFVQLVAFDFSGNVGNVYPYVTVER